MQPSHCRLPGSRSRRRTASLTSANLSFVFEFDRLRRWYAILLGSVGDYITTKEKIKNSATIKKSLDIAEAQLPDDPTVALALGQWAFKVASVSFLERQIAKAIFGGKSCSSSICCIQACNLQRAP